jgi:RHS repeat-associated protein
MGYYLTSPTYADAFPETLTPVSKLSESARRFYSPEMGRWMSRDPIEEIAGSQLYSFLANRATCDVDCLGLFSLWDLISIIPGFGTIYNIVVRPPGSRVSEYRIDLSYQKCCALGSDAAEFACIQSITRQVGQYEVLYHGLTTAHALADAVLELWPGAPPWFRVAVGVDLVVDLLVTARRTQAIADAGDEAKKQCDCEKYGYRE